jgi:hypothetical protein
LVFFICFAQTQIKMFKEILFLQLEYSTVFMLEILPYAVYIRIPTA